MPSTLREYAVLAVRFLLVGGGLLVAGGTVYGLATMPPAPPNGDGFVEGLAYLFGSMIVALGLGAATVGLVLPTALGADDPIGFGRGQRLLLKGAGLVVGGGFLVALAVGIYTELQFGLLLWLALLPIAAVVAALAVIWRGLEALVGVARRAADSRA